MPKTRSFTTRTQKMDWLRQNRHLWQFKTDEEMKNHKILHPILEQMKQEGLYSKETFNYDIAFSVRKMVHEIKQGVIA